MRILLIWAAADWSIFDQSQGYFDALTSLGHEVIPFRLNRRLVFWSLALKRWQEETDPDGPDTPLPEVMRAASEQALTIAARYRPDLILLTSAMGFHPDAIAMLRTHGYPIAMTLSECPYDDVHHAHIAPLVDWVFANDRNSVPVLREHNPNTYYLPTAYHHTLHSPHPDVPIPPDAANVDVLFVGTGFPERVRFLEEAVSDPAWPPAANFQIHGFFVQSDPNLSSQSTVAPAILSPDSPLIPYLHPPIQNSETALRYSQAKIVLNFYRDNYGYSVSPRAYEIAACGAFQLAQDGPPEAHALFGDTIAYFSTPQDLAAKVAAYLDPTNTAVRMALAYASRERVRGQSYVDRATALLDIVGTDLGLAGGVKGLDLPPAYANIEGFDTTIPPPIPSLPVDPASLPVSNSPDDGRLGIPFTLGHVLPTGSPPVL